MAKFYSGEFDLVPALDCNQSCSYSYLI